MGCLILQGKLLAVEAYAANATLIKLFALRGAQCEQRLYLAQYFGVEVPFGCHRSRLVRKILLVDLLQTRCRSVWVHAKIVRRSTATAAR
jgi:hypothetical protein